METTEMINIWWAGGKDFFNYGDALGPYLIEKISGKKPNYVPKRGPHRVNLIIGSIINRMGTTPFCDVWGCGIIDRTQTAQNGAKFYAVRGPLTRRSLLRTGHHCPEIYGDPALLLPRFYKPTVKKEYELGIIPHYVDYDRVKKEIHNKNINIIDFKHPNIEETTDEINKCKKIISSSLHGIIVAQAYNIPTLWVKLSNKLSGDDVKYADYFLSVGVAPYQPFNFINKPLSCEKDLIKLVDDNPTINKIISFDGDKLLESCPFYKKNRNEDIK